jgi:hypothetical protein
MLTRLIAMISAERIKSGADSAGHCLFLDRSGVDGGRRCMPSIRVRIMRRHHLMHLFVALETEEPPPIINRGVIAHGVKAESSNAAGSRNRILFFSEPRAIRPIIGNSRSAAKPTT